VGDLGNTEAGITGAENNNIVSIGHDSISPG